MPLYMVHFAYSAEAWQGLIAKPEDRTSALDAMAKQAGGRLVGLYYHPGEFDGFVLMESPDDLTANATVMAVQAAGGVRATRTTKLFTAKEFVDALGRAGKVAYRPPGKK